MGNVVELKCAIVVVVGLVVFGVVVVGLAGAIVLLIAIHTDGEREA